MRDFNNGRDFNVNGNLTITDNSNNSNKLLIDCSNEELRNEIPFRQENIRIEQSEKVKKAKCFYILAGILMLSAVLCAYYFGKTSLITIILGMGGFGVAAHTLIRTYEPNGFQNEEMQAIKEAKKILKQRRAE